MEEINDEKILKRTDLKPIEFNFNGSSDDLIKKFFFKIKPIEGIVKYHLVNWGQFPTDLEQAKQLAKDWATNFSENKKFTGLVTNIYFHLEKKTIRFEIKKYLITEVKNFTLIKAESKAKGLQCESLCDDLSSPFDLKNQNGQTEFDERSEITKSLESEDFSEQILNYKKQIFDLIETNKGIYMFDSSCWEGLELDKCKELGKLWSQELETRENFAGLKVIIFFNPSKKNIKVTIK